MLTATDPKDAVPGAADIERRALEAADIGPWQWDLNTGTICLSVRAARLLGCPGTRSLDYAGFIALIHADDRTAADETLQGSAAATGAFDFVVRTATLE